MTEPRTRRLGRGLEALLGPALVQGKSDATARQIPVGAIRPNPYQPRHDFPEAALAELAERRGERDVARRRYRTFVAFYNAGPRRSSRELAAVARAAWHLGAEDPELFKDALRAYDEAIAADSTNLDARVAEGNLFLDKYNGTDAGAAFKAVLAINPRHAGALLGLARTAYFDGGPEALPRAKQALEVNPHFVPALLFLARLDLESEAYDRAREDIRRALAVDASSLEAIALLAATRSLTGDSAGFGEAVPPVLWAAASRGPESRSVPRTMPMMRVVKVPSENRHLG